MRPRSIALAIVAAATVLASPTATASAQTVIENDSIRVELIGLKRWTIPMIQDSLARYAPKETLLSHACAANLRMKLKFADASVSLYPASGSQSRENIVVTVIEPQDSALVQYRDTYGDSLPARADWAPALKIFVSHNMAVQDGLQRGLLFGSGSASDTAKWREFQSFDPDTADATAVRALRAFLNVHHRERDLASAQHSLATDGNWQNRVIATLIVASFGAQDAAWRSEVETLRDPDGRVAGTASQALTGMQQPKPRTIDWTSEAPTLRLLLGGTDLFEHNAVMRLLVATKIDPALAPELLANNSGIVLSKLAASTETNERAIAHAFFVQMASHDYGFDPAAWQPWLNSLQSRAVAAK
jgi:hypothetical protein